MPALLTNICGLPGTGKTTLAMQIERATGAIRLCPDEWMDDLGVNLWDTEVRARVESLQWKLGRQLLARGQSVVVEWGTWARAERDRLRHEALALGADLDLIVLDVPLDELYRRISARGRENPPIRREDLEEWAELFQSPDEDEIEAWRLNRTD